MVLFCTDDLTALLVKRIADGLNKSIKVVGFDGTEFMKNYYPDLATIQQPISDLAELLADLIIRKTNDEEVDIAYQLPVKLYYGDL